MKFFVLISAGLYSIGLLIGFSQELNLSPQLVVESGDFLAKQLFRDNAEAFVTIFRNNLNVILINYFGFFSVGITSAMNVFYNGYVLGYALKACLQVAEFNIVLRYFVPHSMELVAIILSSAIGIKIGTELLVSTVCDRDTYVDLKSIILNMMINVSIIIIAALIEAHVSLRVNVDIP